MGAMVSARNDYWTSKFVMGADQEIDFRFDQIHWIEQAKSWGRAEALAQAQQTGLLTGGGGGAVGGNAFGYGQMFWKSVNDGIHSIGMWATVLALAGVLIGFFVKVSPLFMFGLLWAFLFFLSHAWSYASETGRAQLSQSTLPIRSFILGGVVAALIAFAAYQGFYYDTDGEMSYETKVGIGSFGGAVLIVVFILFGYSKSAKAKSAMKPLGTDGAGINNVGSTV